MSLNILLKTCKYMSDSDLEKIANAHAFAEHFHKSQIRKSKNPTLVTWKVWQLF